MQAPTSQVGNLRRNDVPKPTPVTSAIREHISWTASIKGNVNRAVHNIPKPNWLPTWE